ncbi:MAG: DUF2332 family protein [Myxococcales bacterium]|nr:DUF2332 family protein [Myxococcales bacterium]
MSSAGSSGGGTRVTVPEAATGPVDEAEAQQSGVWSAAAGSGARTWMKSIRRQAGFARGYSPLYAAILDALAGWLAPEQADGPQAAVRTRFLAFAGGQAWDNDLEPILKLAAALHSFVLAGDPRVQSLRAYYLTVTPDGVVPGEGFAGDFSRALDALGDELVQAARAWQIQTNETGRGVVWLLPAALLQVEAAYLVELGASAGLNLYADQRRFDLRWQDGAVVTLGHAEAPQFEVACEGPAPGEPLTLRAPEVLARVGADARVVDLAAPGAETQLAACVWGDQPQRMARLREALALRRRYQGTEQAARLVRAELPDDLEDFLRKAVPTQPVAPVILFDTYVTAYFNDVAHGALVRGVEAFARPWTLRHRLPWLWVRFEPPRVGAPPQVGWCRWWVEVWTQGRRRTIELGWAHPHGMRAVFGPGLAELAALRGPE